MTEKGVQRTLYIAEYPYAPHLVEWAQQDPDVLSIHQREETALLITFACDEAVSSPWPTMLTWAAQGPWKHIYERPSAEQQTEIQRK